MANVKGEMFNQ